MNNYLKYRAQRLINETLEQKANEVMDKLKFNKPGSSFDYVEEEECVECGNNEMYEGNSRECMECGSGEVYEGECMECGWKNGGEMMEDDSESENRYNRTKDDEIIHHWMDNGRHTLKGKLDRGNKFVAHSYETDSNDDMTKKWYQNQFDKVKGTGHEYKRNDDFSSYGISIFQCAINRSEINGFCNLCSWS